MEGKEGSVCISLQINVRIDAGDVLSFVEKVNGAQDDEIARFTRELREPSNLVEAITQGRVDVMHSIGECLTVDNVEAYMWDVWDNAVEGG